MNLAMRFDDPDLSGFTQRFEIGKVATAARGPTVGHELRPPDEVDRDAAIRAEGPEAESRLRRENSGGIWRSEGGSA